MAASACCRGILGFPFIAISRINRTAKLQASNAALSKRDVEKNYLLGDYKAIDP